MINKNTVEVTINTLPNCPWCVKAKKLLDRKGLKYTEINGKSEKYPTVPYIEFNGETVGGCVELAYLLRHGMLPR